MSNAHLKVGDSCKYCSSGVERDAKVTATNKDGSVNLDVHADGGSIVKKENVAVGKGKGGASYVSQPE